MRQLPLMAAAYHEEDAATPWHVMIGNPPLLTAKFRDKESVSIFMAGFTEGWNARDEHPKEGAE